MPEQQRPIGIWSSGEFIYAKEWDSAGRPLVRFWFGDEALVRPASDREWGSGSTSPTTSPTW